MAQLQIGHLVTLGLEKDEAEIYAGLLTCGSSTVEEFAEQSGRRPESVQQSFSALVDIGLVSSLAPNRTSVAPIPPDAGLTLLTRRREIELLQARVAAADAFAAFRRSLQGDPAEHLIEVIHGAAVNDRIHQIEHSARADIRAFDSPPYYAGVHANQVELENLARGVSYRAVYGKVALERSDYLAENVLPCVRAGEEARTLPEVPVKLLIVDEECAVVALSAPDGEADCTALLIRPCSLLTAVIGLFEMSWRAGLPLQLREHQDGSRLLPSEHRLLGLLAAGLGDDQVIRALGVSRRTFFRYLEGLMARTGSANRFQLALHAVRNGWI